MYKPASALPRALRPTMAERLFSPEEMLEKPGGKCIAEYKYYGERLQAHKRGDEVTLYTRLLGSISSQYRDAVDLFKKCVKAKEVIFECERGRNCGNVPKPVEED
jgi:DNA ligase-1